MFEKPGRVIGGKSIFRYNYTLAENLFQTIWR